MKPELWQSPYTWTAETAEIRRILLEYFSSLTQGKRLMHDPFEDKILVRCTQAGCKVRYELPDFTTVDMSDFKALKKFVCLIAINPHFYHISSEIKSIGKQAQFVYMLFQNESTQIFICPSCGENSPFPLPFGYTRQWSHHCGNGWGLDMAKPNTMSWMQIAWVCQINFHAELWMKLRLMGLESNGAVKYDAKNTCFLVSEAKAAEVVSLCKTYFPTFKQMPKPQSRAMGAALPKRAKAASDVLDCLSADLIKKIQRLVRVELHPDKNPDGLKQLQQFEEAFNRWQKEKGAP